MARKQSHDEFTGEVLFAMLEARGISEYQLARELGMSHGQVHGRVYRYRLAQKRKGVQPRPDLFFCDLGAPLELVGDWMVAGDVHAPCTDYDFAILPAVIAQAHMRRPRRLVIAGDLINLDQFSNYERINSIPNWGAECAAARQLLREWLQVFDEIVWLMGNHERRLSRKTWGQLMADDLARMVLDDPRVRVSQFGYCTIETPMGLWRITHSKNYSVNQLTVADQLAQKHRCHIISHHEHHLAIGWDRYKHQIVINNGGLFDQEKLTYVALDDSKTPNMMQGFTMLRDGFPYVFGPEPFTNWADWLPARAAKRAA